MDAITIILSITSSFEQSWSGCSASTHSQVLGTMTGMTALFARLQTMWDWADDLCEVLHNLVEDIIEFCRYPYMDID